MICLFIYSLKDDNQNDEIIATFTESSQYLPSIIVHHKLLSAISGVQLTIGFKIQLNYFLLPYLCGLKF